MPRYRAGLNVTFNRFTQSTPREMRKAADVGVQGDDPEAANNWHGSRRKCAGNAPANDGLCTLEI